MIRHVHYREAIPKARTKAHSEQSRQQFGNRFPRNESGKFIMAERRRVVSMSNSKNEGV
jgi:hypothetical protein